MLADPQTVTVSAVAQDMPATYRGANESKYTEDVGEYDLHISHQYGTRNRRVVRLNHTKIAADPITAVNASVSASMYLVIDEPKWGFTDAELESDLLGFFTWLDSAARAKILGGES